jgi:intein/homing endonuclease
MSKYTPRPLTEEEIEDIISGIEKMTHVVKSATQMAQNEVKDLLRKQLSSIELVPEAIPEMKKIIRNQYNRAVIEPQTPVGLLVSEALSQPITQMTLNSVIGETLIVIQDKEKKESKVVPIGDWIDELLLRNQDKIVNIPENRTEYLELETPVMIPSTTCDGKSEWMELTAVTRHLPVGYLVKVTTRSGRQVTATSQKSFLIYDETEDKLKEKNGKDLKTGDYVGIHLSLENDDLSIVPDIRKDMFYYSRKSKFSERIDDNTITIVDINREHCPYKSWRDIILDPIVSIESIPSENRSVYDVTVPKSLNFNTYHGIVMSD